MNRFISRNFTRVLFLVLFILFFIVLRNFKRNDSSGEDAEIKYKLPPAETESEEMQRNMRRMNLNSIQFEGISPPNNNNVFFILSESVEDQFFPRYVSFRQVCSIESALKAYPEHVIYVIFITHRDSVMFQLSKSLYGLSSRNIVIVKLNIKEFIESTPFDLPAEFLSSSLYQQKHTIDIIRLILLYKYGGVYIDTETMVLKNPNSTNFLCDEGFYSIVDNIIGLDDRNLVEVLIDDMLKNLKGDEKDQQGSILLTRVMEKLCQSPRAKMKIDRRNCEGYNILNKDICFPLDSTNYWKLFDESQMESVLRSIENASLVHLWNPLAKHLRKSENNAAAQLIIKHCPKTYSLASETDFMEF